MLLVQACSPPEQEVPFEQAPFSHFWPELQLLEQLPQWFASLFVSTHWPPQSVSPGRQMQEPLLQIWSERHWVPQLPQCLGSFCRSIQRLVPQVEVPGPQPHWPPTQACVSAHCLPHAPQLLVLVAVSTSHPLVALPSQSAKLALHEKPQVEALQVRDTLARTGQTWLQDPQ